MSKTFWDQPKKKATPLVKDPETPLDHALLYATRGWHVIPTHTVLKGGLCSCGMRDCKSPGKHPRTPHGKDDASTNPSQIRAWWEAFPDANVAIVCGEVSGLVVIDVDPRNGGDCSLEELQTRHGKLPDQCVAQTGSGGLHIYMRHPGGTLRGKLGPGIDVQGDGKYVVAPPSIHATGGTYQWIDDAAENYGAEVPEAPQWLVDLLRVNGHEPASESPRTAFTRPAVAIGELELARIESALEYIEAETRESWRTVGMALHALGAGSQGWLLWCEWSARSSKFDEKDQARVWKSFRHDKAVEVTVGTIFHLARQAGWVYVEPRTTQKVFVPPPEPEPEAIEVPPEVLTVPGVLGQLVGWYRACAPIDQPLYAVVAALSLGSIAASRIYATDLNNYSSAYFVVLGESGGGKEFIRTSVTRALQAAGLKNLIGPGRYASGSGLVSELLDKPAHITFQDEFGRMLRNLGTPGQHHAAEALTTLMELFSLLGEEFRGKSYSRAGLNKQQRQAMEQAVIERPGVTLVGLTTPDRFLEALGDDEVQDGFLGRLVVIRSDEPLSRARPKPMCEIPDELIHWLKGMRLEHPEQAGLGYLAAKDSATGLPAPILVRVTPEAMELYEQFADECIDQAIELKKSNRAELVKRWAEIALRIAMVVALSNSYQQRQVNPQDMAWAIAFVRWHGMRFIDQADRKLGLSAFARAHEKTVEYILAQREPVAMWELTNRVRCVKNMMPRERREIAESLANDSRIQLVKPEPKPDGSRKGRPEADRYARA